MKNRLRKFILPLLIVIVVVSIGFNIYQNSRITIYKEDLTIILREELEQFAGKIGNGLSEENVYAEEYGHIASAQKLVVVLNNSKGYTADKYNYTLSQLLQEIKMLMLNDKTKVDKVFKNTNGDKLMFDIALNFEDKESIEKVFKLLDK